MTIKDLGVMFDTKLPFEEHMESAINKSFSLLLGFMEINTKWFESATCLIHLFKSLVPNFLYPSIIWTPYDKNDIRKLESGQHAFL